MSAEPPAGGRRSPLDLLKAALALALILAAVLAFASWYWTGDWTWMFNPR